MHTEMSRREALKIAGMSAAGLMVAPALAHAGLSHAGQVQPIPRSPARALRIAHLTDIHVQPELRAGEGMSACLRHVNAMADKPNLIITGGDQVMDTFDQGHDRSKTLWELWKSCLKNDNGVPIEHVLGNHDIW